MLGGCTRILFVPFASGDPEAYAELMRKALGSLGIGIGVDSLHEASDQARAVREAEAFFVGGGNSFRLLRALRRLDVLDGIRDAVRRGAPYLGASACRTWPARPSAPPTTCRSWRCPRCPHWA